jgi:hypothetical protein
MRPAISETFDVARIEYSRDVGLSKRNKVPSSSQSLETIGMLATFLVRQVSADHPSENRHLRGAARRCQESVGWLITSYETPSGSRE